MADDSALVFIAPGDSVDAIVRKIRETGASSIQLLVPDDTTVLQARRGFARLRQLIEGDGVSLLVISSDEQTLSAARLNQIDTVGVQGARVMPPDLTGIGEHPADARATVPLDDDDAEFLDALDQMSFDDRYLGQADADAYSGEFEDLSDAIRTGRDSDRDSAGDDEFAAALGDWSARDPRSPGEQDWEIGPRAAPAPRRRVRPEDVALNEDDLRRQRSTRRARAAATPVFERDAAAEDRAPSRAGLGLAIPLLLLLLIAVGAGFWYLRSRATIVVAAPVADARQQQFDDEIIPLASGEGKSPGAIQAIPISTTAEFQVQGQVISETLSPVGSAKGTLTIYNTIGQTIQLPDGTQFVAVKEGGQEVRFKLDVPANVPAATTSSSVAGSNTAFGQIDVAVTALSPGSASNVGENTIKQIVIPGQDPIAVGAGNFNIQHGPLTGGSEQLVRVVTEDDVQRKLQEALTGLYNTGIKQLEAQLDTRSEIDPVSITPDADALSRPENYEIVVEPAVGAQVPTTNPNFTVTVRTRFGGLATPRGQLIGTQLETALREHFQSPCKPGETARIEVSDYRWDGQRLAVDSTLTCVPSGGLAPETASQVKRAVGGKTRAEAEQNLQALQEQGLIGAYQLPPDRDSFPSLDFLLQVEEAQPSAPQPTTIPATATPVTATP
jgi:hypothetical protein